MIADRRPARRKGLATVPALVCLLLVAMFCAAMLRLARVERDAASYEEDRMQAEWLAESGAGRARARLASDAGYRGETWKTADAMGGRVVIAVEPDDDRRRVRVEAEYPADGDRRARSTKRFTLELRPKTPGGPS